MSPELADLQEIVSAVGQRAVAEKPNRLVELKGDRSLVTNVDKLVEQILRKELVSFIPGSTVWGEEFGWSEPGESGIWLVDPIDGTSNFAYGNPLWGVSVAFADSQGLRYGVISLPEMGIDLSSERGGGAYWNNKLLPPIDAGPVLETELLSMNDAALRAVGRSLPGKQRLSGAFVIDGAFTVKQWFRALVGVNEKLYDVAASVLAARELGAHITYMDGTSWDENELLSDSKIAKPWGILPQGSGLV